MKDRFVRLQLKELRKLPLTEERIKDALYNAWDHGASTALLLPAWAYSKVDEQRREAYARRFLSIIVLNDYNDLYGENPSLEHLARIVDKHIKEEKVVPFVTLTPDFTISGEVSRN